MHSKKGSILLMCLIMASFAMLLVIILQAMGSSYWQTQGIIAAGNKQRVKENLKVIIAEEIINSLEAKGVFPNVDPDVAPRKARIATVGTWGNKGTVSTVSYNAQTGGSPFSKANVLGASSGNNSQHPLTSKTGTTFNQTVSAVFNDFAYTGIVNCSYNVELREIPVSEVGFVAVNAFNPSTNNVGVTVTGNSVLTKGYVNGSVPVKLSSTSVITPTIQTGTGISATNLYFNPLYRFSWGSNSPSNIVGNYNQLDQARFQSYFDQSQAVVTIQNGEVFNGIAGVAIREFPTGSGVIRVVVTLNSISASNPRIYVNCVSASDRNNGVVVIGDGGSPSGPNKVVVTNGSVWLWGSNSQPCIIGSGNGQWTFNDSSWSEVSPGNAALNMVWAGLISAPVDNVFSTSQSAGGAKLTLTGTLVSGNISGSLPSVFITESTGTAIRSYCEKILFAYNLTSSP